MKKLVVRQVFIYNSIMVNDIIHKKQNLKYLKWDLIRSSSGTAGSFLKSEDSVETPKTYYKLSNYDSVNGVFGHECVNEIIVDRLLTILEIDHLHYELIHADINVSGKIIETYLCASKDFKKDKEKKVSLETFYGIMKNEDESPIDFCKRMKWDKYIYQMLLVDYLILNRDRHGANIEVLRNSKGEFRLAPLFDHGLSLLFNCHSDKDVDKYDVMDDKAVQCFVGSHSAYDNLFLIPKNKYPKVNGLKESDKEILLEGLDDIISKKLRDKIWEMIYKRWKVYEDLRNQRWIR